MLTHTARRRRRPAQVALLGLIVALCALIAPAQPVAAHPLGNFSVNRYTRIEPGEGGVYLRTIVDMAEIPTLQERPRIDGDGDGELSQAERDGYMAELTASLAAQMELRVDGRPLPLAIGARSLALLPGQGGLQTMRVEAELTAELPAGPGPWRAEFRDGSYAGRPGWRELVVRAGDGVRLLESSAPAEDTTRELTSYPVDILRGLPSESQASFSFVAGEGGGQGLASAAPHAAARGGDQLSALVLAPIDGPLGLLAALALAMALGAGHALAPGHGKTVVAAYLVGSRGTVGHALFLGLTTTVAHTAGVFALGLITLFVSSFLLPEQLYPWLSALSGAIVCLLGLALFRQRLGSLAAPADHSHDGLDAAGAHSHGFGAHSHAPAGAPASWRGLLALGVSGGLLPCPSALVMLLGSVALGRAGLGLLLVLAFSLGLAGVLTLVGVLLVRARGLFARLPAGGAVARYLPVAGAAAVALAGLGITLQALAGLF